MTYVHKITHPHYVTIEGATREHLLWLSRERPHATFSYEVLEHHHDDTLVVKFLFEDEAEAAIFRLFWQN